VTFIVKPSQRQRTKEQKSRMLNKNEGEYDPASPLLVICLKECKSGYNKGTCTPMFIAALFTIAKIWKQPRCLTTDEWIKTM
jgi:hypothetical protein